MNVSETNRNLGLGGLVRSVFKIYGRHFGQIYGFTLAMGFLTLAALLALPEPYGALSTFSDASFTEQTDADGADTAPDEPSDESSDANGAAASDGSGSSQQSGEERTVAETAAELDIWSPWAIAENVIPSVVAAFYFAVLAAFVVGLGSGTSPRLPGDVGLALKRTLPLFMVNFIVPFLVGLGLLLLIVPGLWLLGVFAVVAPVVAVEGRFLGALKRSAALTKGYRWPCLVFVLIMVLIFVPFSLAIGVLAGFLTVALAPMGVTAAALSALVVFVLVFALVFPLGALWSTVLYVRLRELKEGPG